MSKLAVIKTGGKEYLVGEGTILKIEKIEGKAGDKTSFSQILLLADGEGKEVEIGKPTLAKAKVEAEILEQGRGDKVSVIKYKPKVRYRKKVGHRQLFTKIKIIKIG